MTIRYLLPRFTLMSLICFCGTMVSTAEDKTPKSSEIETEREQEVEIPRVSLEAARERAELMHLLYNSTLETLHDRYFHGDRAMVPARAMKDVFRDMERQTHTQVRWISASLRPMSIDNKPDTDFEKQAAAEISKGESMFETVEDGYYRRAGSISLNHGCIGCHAGFSSNSSSRKFAGLIISVPVNRDAALKPDLIPSSKPTSK